VAQQNLCARYTKCKRRGACAVTQQNRPAGSTFLPCYFCCRFCCGRARAPRRAPFVKRANVLSAAFMRAFRAAYRLLTTRFVSAASTRAFHAACVSCSACAAASAAATRARARARARARSTLLTLLWAFARRGCCVNASALRCSPFVGRPRRLCCMRARAPRR